MSQPYKMCPRCQSPADLDAPACVHCGRQYKTQFVAPEQTQAFIPPAAPQYLPPQSPQPLRDPIYDRNYRPPDADEEPANQFVICLMWIITGLATVIVYTGDRTMAIIVDGVAVCCAICLIMSKSRVNKNHGKAKLGLELFAALMGFLAVILNARAQSGNWQ